MSTGQLENTTSRSSDRNVMGPGGPLAQRGDLFGSSEQRKPCAGASGQSGWATCVHQGATVSDHRTLAGATVGAPSTHRPRDTHRPGCPSGITANTDRHVRSDRTNRGLEHRSRCLGSPVTSGFRRSVAKQIRVCRIRLGQAVRDSRPSVGEPSSDTVPGEEQLSIGETTAGGHQAPKGVRLLERERL